MAYVCSKCGANAVEEGGSRSSTGPVLYCGCEQGDWDSGKSGAFAIPAEEYRKGNTQKIVVEHHHYHHKSWSREDD